MANYIKINNKLFFTLMALIGVAVLPARAASGKITVARAFYELAHKNDTQKIENLIARGYSLESWDEKGYTAVCLSVVRNDKPAYNALIKAGADKNPACLKQIPDTAYRRFFGLSERQTPVPAYSSDKPYLIGTGMLVAGAAAAAYIFRGDTGSSSDGGDTPTPEPTPGTDCPDNSTYTEGECVCNSGYGHYGDESQCYATISHCSNQSKDVCSACSGTYILYNNACYAVIAHCASQTGETCNQCETGYGIHGGDGSRCYADIDNCAEQALTVCNACNSGYGTYGDDTQCNKTIANCLNQSLDVCKQCNPGYDTYGNPYKCYEKNPCADYPNSKLNTSEVCVCDEGRGYTGDPYNGGCSQTSGGEYNEGDDKEELWNNYNELYCNSHGKYDVDTQTCACYQGYKNGGDCSECADTYIKLNGVCYRDLECSSTIPNSEQSANSCVCSEGYVEYYESGKLQCIEAISCGENEQQVGAECVCKPNFDEACESCAEGYEPDGFGNCTKDESCDEYWTGSDCSTCPENYQITEDDSGKHCTTCADGYEFSRTDNACIVTDCSSGVDGYIKDEETGICGCDTANGWRMSKLGKCEKPEEDLIGQSDSNINNAVITIENDGILRDVYGMKPVIKDDEGNETYYDSVYNSLTAAGEKMGSINITNSNTGGNFVYGIYSQSDIYNAAVINSEKCESCPNNYATGNIMITDKNTSSDIYGIINSSENNIYNGFSYAASEIEDGTMNVATGNITITKDEKSSGSITGISGGKNIYNAYANTTGGINANTKAVGVIDITHNGTGDIVGIRGTNSSGKISNSLAYLDSAISKSVSEGTIKLSGSDNVYGIYGIGAVSNSETQFDRNFNILKDFSSYGVIDVTTDTGDGAAYGIYSEGDSSLKTSIYNAIGYRSTGDITVRNTAGGSAVGIYSKTATYRGEDGEQYYNNTYNAFRSSAVYGTTDENSSVTTGNIEMIVSGYSSQSQQIIGIFAAGNVYNSYANSGSDVKLETVGNITINDSSSTNNNIKGIESNGATIANAYSMAPESDINNNTDTKVTGNININITGMKSQALAAGIYSDSVNEVGTKIYNAGLENNTNTVSGTITVKAEQTSLPKNMYGIYASSYKIGETIDNAQPKTVYNAYYSNSEDVSAGTVLGTINVQGNIESSLSETGYYGIYILNGKAYNAYSTNANANVTGVINVEVSGRGEKSVAAGLYGENAELDNSGANSSINVTTNGTISAYGMKGEESYLTNNALINVTSKSSGKAYGMYVDKGSAINNGTINVTGNGENYGIYAISDNTESGKAVVYNNGTINLSGSGKNTGIYATGSTATVHNSGTVTINGESCSGSGCNNNSAIVLENNAVFENDGTVVGTESLNLNDWGGNVVLNKSGKFIAENSISGDLQVSADIVNDTFENTSVVENALSAADINNLNVSSKSYLYKAKIAESDTGRYNVLMDIKDFNEVTDEDMAQYLSQNYANQKNQNLFNALKSASDAGEYSQVEAQLSGNTVLPNIVQENLKVQRSLDSTIMSDLFKSGGEVRRMVGADSLYIGRDDAGTLSGYDLTSESMYALYDKKIDNAYRLGLGMSFTHVDTDYNNDSSRKSFMVQGYVPFTYTNGSGLTAVSMARLGFSDGDYKRHGYDNHTYEGDTTEITYGLLNELRYTMDIEGIRLTPFAGLNATGWYQDSIKEGTDDFALQLASSHIFSLEGALGVYLDKDIEFSADNKLNIALGAGYYHEFADPYRGIDARINDTIGAYRLRSSELDSRDRGVISAKINYDYRDFSLYGELMQYLEKEYPVKVDVGLKYKF